MTFEEMFPSPCGDVVLKCREALEERYQDFHGFRPLAGMWF